MGYYCTVPQCTSLAGKTKNVKFHRFPSDSTMAAKWNNILKRGKPFTKYSKVCSLHFTPTDYNITTMGQWKTLSKGAIPSQNLPKLNPDGTVMVIRKSRTVKYKECKKEISGKTEKFSNSTQSQTSMESKHEQPLLEDIKQEHSSLEGIEQEQPDSSIAYRLQSNLPLHHNVSPVPKPRKQDAFMQTDPVLSEDEQNESEVDYTFDMKKYDTPQDFSKQNEDYIPQTNEEYNKEAEKYALQRKNHNNYNKMDYQKSVIEESYTKIPDVYNGFSQNEYADFVCPNSYPDSIEVLRNQQHNLQILQEQHRINENQNFGNETQIKQEIEFPNEEKFLYERNKEQIDQSTLYEQREQQRLLDHIAQVKQEPDVASGCDSVVQPQSSPYYSTEGPNHVTVPRPAPGPYYAVRPGPELLIAKQNALAAHTQLWQNQMKRPFFYSESTHYTTPPILHRCEDFSRILQ